MNQPSTRRRLARLAGYALAGLAVFALGMRYLFPYGTLARSLEARLRRAGIEAKIEGLGPGALCGVEADLVTLSVPPQPDLRADLRDVAVAISLPDLLRFRLSVIANTQAFGGTLEANWPLCGRGPTVARWVDVDLGQIPLPPAYSEMGLRGRGAGVWEARLGEAKPSGLAGRLDATVTDACLGPGSIHGVPLPEVSFGSGQLRLSVGRGRLAVATAELSGGNLDATVSAMIDMGATYPHQRVDGVLTLRPDEQAARDLAFFLYFFPGTTGTDGSYSARLCGTLGAMTLSPEGARG